MSLKLNIGTSSPVTVSPLVPIVSHAHHFTDAMCCPITRGNLYPPPSVHLPIECQAFPLHISHSHASIQSFQRRQEREKVPMVQQLCVPRAPPSPVISQQSHFPPSYVGLSHQQRRRLTLQLTLNLDGESLKFIQLKKIINTKKFLIFPMKTRAIPS